MSHCSGARQHQHVSMDRNRTRRTSADLAEGARELESHPGCRVVLDFAVEPHKARAQFGLANDLRACMRHSTEHGASAHALTVSPRAISIVDKHVTPLALAARTSKLSATQSHRHYIRTRAPRQHSQSEDARTTTKHTNPIKRALQCPRQRAHTRGAAFMATEDVGDSPSHRVTDSATPTVRSGKF